jgi:ankyrin repeat protein
VFAVCIFCFNPARAAEKQYQPTELMAKCVEIELPKDPTGHECKFALQDAKNNMEVHRLLERGHNPNTMLPRSSRPLLLLATQMGQKEIVAELVNYGMTLDPPTDPNIKSDTGHTSLIFAAGKGDADLVRIFLGTQQGVDINHATTGGNKIGYNALHMAVNFGHQKVVKLLIDAGCDPNLKTGDGMTAEGILDSTKVKIHPKTKDEIREYLKSFVDLGEDDEGEF